MLLHGTEPLAEAVRARTAIAGFTAYNLETVQAICAAAETAAVPVILQAGSSGFRHAGRESLARLALSAAQQSSGLIGVHLDHSRDFDEINACVDLGYTSVMVDGSHLPYAENVALTRRVLERAHAAGVWVEAELGKLAGDEDVSTDARGGGLHRPRRGGPLRLGDRRGRARRGGGQRPRVHQRAGTTRPGPVVRHPCRLSRAARAARRQRFAHCGPRRGVAKVNVNAELRRAFLDAIAAGLPLSRAGDDVAGLLSAGRSAVAAARDIALALAGTSQRGPRVTTPEVSPS
jgi:fructose/tagatose bisphosphate aldolase